MWRSSSLRKDIRRIRLNNNINIINQSVEKPKHQHDYLLHKRIERAKDPEKAFKRRHYWNMSLREDCKDDDYIMMHLKAQEVARKALVKEEYIMKTLDEKDKMEQNNEIDKMLIDSLKAKIKLINDL